jgi:predicted SnoaL-like aldol condensation-catalyzing enzyme
MTQVDARRLVRHYLDAFYSGEFDRAASVLADSFAFEGPFVKVAGRDAFLRSAEGLKKIVRGHRLLRQWVDGDDVISVFELQLETPQNKGAVTMSEWHTAEEGKLVRGFAVFDSAAFRAITAPRA